MIGNVKDLKKIDFTGPLVHEASMKVLVSDSDGWDNHVMRVVELKENGYSPKHQHPWPHINYFLEGNGELEIDGIVTPVSAGNYAFVPGNTLHQFRNKGVNTFKFICIVPKEGHKY